MLEWSLTPAGAELERARVTLFAVNPANTQSGARRDGRPARARAGTIQPGLRVHSSHPCPRRQGGRGHPCSVDRTELSPSLPLAVSLSLLRARPLARSLSLARARSLLPPPVCVWMRKAVSASQQQLYKRLKEAAFLPTATDVPLRGNTRVVNDQNNRLRLRWIKLIRFQVRNFHSVHPRYKTPHIASF